GGSLPEDRRRSAVRREMLKMRAKSSNVSSGSMSRASIAFGFDPFDLKSGLDARRIGLSTFPPCGEIKPSQHGSADTTRCPTVADLAIGRREVGFFRRSTLLNSDDAWPAKPSLKRPAHRPLHPCASIPFLDIEQ